MFSSAAHSVVHFARSTAFATLRRQARFLSVSTMSSTKNLYSESVLFSEKPSKAAKARKSNGKKLEKSQLYPHEMKTLNDYDFLEEFDLLMDDTTPSTQKDPGSGELKSVARKSEAVEKMPSTQKDPGSGELKSVARKSEAVEKMPSTQKDPGSGELKSVARKSEAVDKMPSTQKDPGSGELKSVARKSEVVDKMPSMQEVQGSVWQESVARKSEVIKLVESSETKETDLDENDLGEKLSDSDSESEAEDHYGGRRKSVSDNFKVNLNNLKMTKLSRRSRFFSEKMEKAESKKDGLVLNDHIGGIFALARLGIKPEALFFCSPEVLKYYPGDLSDIGLYITPFEDMKYWASKVKGPNTAIIGLYREKILRLKNDFSDPEMPLTIICDQIWHRIGFSQILSTVYLSPPKLFITSEGCVDAWNGAVVRNSFGCGIFLNHDFGLTWQEIRQKVNEKDRVYLLELTPFRDRGGDETNSHFSSLPSVYLYDHNFWNRENFSLIVTYSYGTRVPEELSRFCFERKARRIDLGLTRRPSSTFHLASFPMVFFELRRQWLAAINGNLSKTGSKNRTNAKSRVRIVSTLFKT